MYLLIFVYLKYNNVHKLIFCLKIIIVIIRFQYNFQILHNYKQKNVL